MIPATKTKEIEDFLETLTPRKKSIRNNMCLPKPIGCGGPATYFTDHLSQTEYAISGLCQLCQDAFFGGAK